MNQRDKVLSCPGDNILAAAHISHGMVLKRIRPKLRHAGCTSVDQLPARDFPL
jgi:hypothetical protein